jgi:hypothetical protein
MLALVAASALLGQGLEYGSGQWWHTLYVEGGNGPSTRVRWQLAWPKEGGDEYRITTYRAGGDMPSERLKVFTYKGAIQFKKLIYHANPCNDIWEEKGKTIKQFPSALLVGHGVENDRPVTVVWSMKDSEVHEPATAIKVFDGDDGQLNGVPRTYSSLGGLLYERAKAEWIPADQRPKGVTKSDQLQRLWMYSGRKFVIVFDWRIKNKKD